MSEKKYFQVYYDCENSDCTVNPMLTSFVMSYEISSEGYWQHRADIGKLACEECGKPAKFAYRSPKFAFILNDEMYGFVDTKL